MSNTKKISLKIPQQNLDRCQFFECNETSVDKWADSLPMANLGQATRHLYYALEELNKVRLMPTVRMMVLEKLRKPAHLVCKALSKHFLNQPIVLPEQSEKVAELTFTVHQALSTGYKLVAAHTVALEEKQQINNPEDLVATALHRATTDLTLNIQRYYQLYQPVEKGLWNSLHQFYALAKQLNLARKLVIDDEYGDGIVESSYIKALLIGCAKPNQLRQEDFEGLYLPLNEWSKYCQISSANNDSLFVFNPDSDRAPAYQSLITDSIDDNWLCLDTSKLIENLFAVRLKSANSSLIISGKKSYTISRDLLSHLILSWGSVSKRNFMRVEDSESLSICVGLSATHYFVSNEVSFEQLLVRSGARVYAKQQENPFLKVQTHNHREKDVWDSPYENKLGQAEFTLESIDYQVTRNIAPQSKGIKFQSHNLNLINSSSHGYCLVWPKEIVAQLSTGEIVGIKDSRHQNWNIATIRWLNRESAITQLGLELISPSASAYGARVIRKKGGQGEFMRVMVLPEIPVINRPLTILTPRVPFNEDQKVVLNQRGREVQIQLGKKLNDHGTYKLFEISKVSRENITPRNKNGNESEQLKDDYFDSLWMKL